MFSSCQKLAQRSTEKIPNNPKKNEKIKKKYVCLQFDGFIEPPLGLKSKRGVEEPEHMRPKEDPEQQQQQEQQQILHLITFGHWTASI